MSIYALYTGLQIAGSVFGYLGQREADNAQAESELLNADFFDKQADLSEFESSRELDIFSRESDAIIGSAQSALARSGVSFSGSSVAAMAQGALNVRKEKAAIMESGRIKVELARLRADSSRRTANDLRGRGGLQAIGGLLNLGAALTRSK